MSDIRPGDVVVCVKSGRLRGGYPAAPELRKGNLYRVAGTGIIGAEYDDCGQLWVKLTEFDFIYVAHRFRRIDAPDTEVARRIRACRPIKEGVRG